MRWIIFVFGLVLSRSFLFMPVVSQKMKKQNKKLKTKNNKKKLEIASAPRERKQKKTDIETVYSIHAMIFYINFNISPGPESASSLRGSPYVAVRQRAGVHNFT